MELLRVRRRVEAVSVARGKRSGDERREEEEKTKHLGRERERKESAEDAEQAVWLATPADDADADADVVWLQQEAGCVENDWTKGSARAGGIVKKKAPPDTVRAAKKARASVPQVQRDRSETSLGAAWLPYMVTCIAGGRPGLRVFVFFVLALHGPSSQAPSSAYFRPKRSASDGRGSSAAAERTLSSSPGRLSIWERSSLRTSRAACTLARVSCGSAGAVESDGSFSGSGGDEKEAWTLNNTAAEHRLFPPLTERPPPPSPV